MCIRDRDIAQLADTVRRAFEIANSGRKGPVLIDIPKDITAAVCEYQPKQIPALVPNADTMTDEDVATAVQMIQQSKRPFVYTGGGVIASDAAKEVRELVDLIDAPVSSSLMGQGGFDNYDERYMGTVSYTHLDVYKRQHAESVNSLLGPAISRRNQAMQNARF